MNYLDWCEQIPRIILQRRQETPSSRIYGIDITNIELALFGSRAAEIHKYPIDSDERKSFFAAIRAFERLGLINPTSQGGRMYQLTTKGQNFDSDKAPVWRDLCAEVLEDDEAALLRVINRHSPEEGEEYALVRWVRDDVLREELGWPDGGENDRLRPTIASLVSRGFAHNGLRNFSPEYKGPSHLTLVVHASYLGLTWQSRAKRVQDITRLDRGVIRHSLWVLECDETSQQGTAFDLDGVGTVTCDHSLKPGTVAHRADNVLRKYPVRVISRSKDLDLALIAVDHELESTPAGALPLGSSDQVKEGSAVMIAGFPNYRLGDTGTVVTGTVVGFRPYHGIQRMLVDAPIVAGCSGGPVLNNEGYVVGVAASGADRMEEVYDTEKHGVIPIEALKFLPKR